MNQTKKEEYWNTLTHFIGIILSIIGLPLLILANKNLSSFSLFSILFFEFGLLFVYVSSTLYHYVENVKIKNKLRTLDHVSIFYLIAGSYAPVCLITLYNHSGIEIFIAVLGIMFIGTFFKIFYTGKYEKFSLFLYLLMGWLIIFKINTLFELISFNGLMLIIASGLLYTFGTFFYSSKRKYSHAIWHLFVLGGSTTHYLFVLFFIV
ncbi:MAG: hemolysin III family protein [Flavobacteriaceae bacterium]|nr:hemolysin III family protein [Flavobacteriaceae bacterium]